MRAKLGFLGDIRQFTCSLLQCASFHKVGKYIIKHEYDIILAPLAHAEVRWAFRKALMRSRAKDVIMVSGNPRPVLPSRTVLH